SGLDPNTVIAYLLQNPITRESAVLQEKLGDLFVVKSLWPEAIVSYRNALKLNPSDEQKVRLTLTLAKTLLAGGQDTEAYDVYKSFMTENPNYTDPKGIYQQLAGLAEKLGKTSELEEHQRALNRL